MKTALDEKHRVDIVSSEDEALSFVLKNIYNAILLDITLPDKNGLIVMREVLKDKPDFSAIILTSHNEKSIRNIF